MQIYEVIVRPNNFDGHEEDRTIGYYESAELAWAAAHKWVQFSRQPHYKGCCQWEIQVTPITLNETARYLD